MFLGEYKYSFDAKGRVAIPTKYREYLQGKFFISRGTDKCITIYTSEGWENFYKKIEALPDSKAIEVKRYLFRVTQDVEFDSQGRILIPQLLREHAEIIKDAVIIGVGEKAEIWSAENWERKLKSEEGSAVQDILLSLGF